MKPGRIKNITKPFWVPAIAAFYIITAGEPEVPVLVALFFGYLGDLFIMRGRKSWFIAGAFSFLAGHFFYIFSFITDAGGAAVLINRPLFSIFFLIPYIGCAVFIKRSISGNISSVYYAAVFYYTILLLMSYSSILRFRAVPTESFIMTLSGTLLFIISDTLIGVRNFRRKFKGIELIIVVTYLAAQLLIVAGLALNS